MFTYAWTTSFSLSLYIYFSARSLDFYCLHWLESTDFELSNCVRKFRIFGLKKKMQRTYSGGDVNIHYWLLNSSVKRLKWRGKNHRISWSPPSILRGTPKQRDACPRWELRGIPKQRDPCYSTEEGEKHCSNFDLDDICNSLCRDLDSLHGRFGLHGCYS